MGVSHTAAYRHFADKRALLDAVAVQGFEDMLRASDTAVGAAANTARSRPQASEALVNAGARLFERLRQLVAAGQQQGDFRSGDASQLSHACWAMVHGLATLLGVGLLRRSEGSLEAPLESARQALSVFLDGMERR